MFSSKNTLQSAFFGSGYHIWYVLTRHLTQMDFYGRMFPPLLSLGDISPELDPHAEILANNVATMT